MRGVNVYRFHDTVALCVTNSTGETVYMRAKDAQRLARNLNRLVRDIKARRFAQSPIGSMEVPCDGIELAREPFERKGED